MNIVMTANSPGEVSSWLRPMVAAFLDARPQARIHVCLVPCAFASGSEAEVARTIPGVSHVHSPAQTLAWALAGKRPPEVEDGPGLVLFLGGDQMYGALLGRRSGWPAFAYSEGRAAWRKRYLRFFVPHAQARQKALSQGAHSRQVVEVGDLMLDGLLRRWPAEEVRRQLDLDQQRPVVGLFPGSRRFELVGAFPLMLQTASLLACRRSGLQFVASLSPFVTREQLAEALAREGLFTPAPEKLAAALFPEGGEEGAGFPWSPWHRAVWVEWVPSRPAGEGGDLRPVRLLIVRGAPYDVAGASDVVLTLPGSNTAELAGLGVPMVVLVPGQLMSELPLEGLAGIVTGVPWVGPALKRRIILSMAPKMPFTAWPNRRVGRAVVPELRKMVLTADDIAQQTLALLDDGEARARMAQELRDIMGPSGAARRIAQICLEAAGL